MKTSKSTRQIKALGLCSGGLDSILSAMLLKAQGIDVTWICFETPFFTSDSAKNASVQTRIPLRIIDITDRYMEMMKYPKAGFGKNMNPCMDCHALMFAIAGEIMRKEQFDFLFSGEVVGQRPKSQNKNSLRYVEKNSGFDGMILRPLSAKLLQETLMEKQSLVEREKLMAIQGRSRKIQMQLAKEFGIKEYPSPAGGCLLTDKIFSQRLKDLMYVQKHFEERELHLLKHGRHFRLDEKTKVIVGRSQNDNANIMALFDKKKDVLVKHADIPGPDVILSGPVSKHSLLKAAQLCASYTKTKPGERADIKISTPDENYVLTITGVVSEEFKIFMI